MPTIEDDSRGWVERFCKADMPFHFVTNPDPNNPLEKLRNPNLINELTTEAELSGILTLVVERAKEISKTRTITKRSGKEMVAEYNIQSNSVRHFLDTFCEYTPDDKEYSTDSSLLIAYPALETIYTYYCSWCDILPADKVKINRFGAAVRKFCPGAEKKRPHNPANYADRITIYKGLYFKQDDCEAFLKSASGRIGQSRTHLGQTKSIAGRIGQANEDIWIYIREKFGSFSIENSQKLENTCPICPDSDLACPKPVLIRPNVPDIDSQPTTGKIDKENPINNRKKRKSPLDF